MPPIRYTHTRHGQRFPRPVPTVRGSCSLSTFPSNVNDTTFHFAGRLYNLQAGTTDAIPHAGQVLALQLRDDTLYTGTTPPPPLLSDRTDLNDAVY